MKRIITKNEQETMDFAFNFSKKITKGGVIALSGDLGAGKTIFTKGIARAFEVKKNVNSPTFVLMKVYEASGKNKIKKIVHIDAYRANSQEMIDLGIQEYFESTEVLVIIEWPENIKDILPSETVFLNIEHRNGERVILY